MTYTKIVCTLGPASESRDTIQYLINAGMNVARLNCSHGNHTEKAEKIALVRELSSATRPVAILLDNKGPEIRTGSLVDGVPIAVHTGDEIILTIDDCVGTNEKIFVDYPGIVHDVTIDDAILVDDGEVMLRVTGVESNGLRCRVENDGHIGEHKGVNLPNTSVNLPALTDKDKADIRFGCEQKIDRYALSFTRSAQDIHAARAELDKHGGKYIKIIAKIENQQGIDNFEEILAVTDGVMVARGDLGVEVPLPLVPLYQKEIIARCNEAAKPVITATEMLDSMMKNPRPTRAETSDVANAILDGSDAVMLSGETAGGAYPLQAVTTMRAICNEIDATSLYIPPSFDDIGDTTQAIAQAGVMAAHYVEAACIVTATISGRTAREVRKHNPMMPIIALTQHAETYHQLLLSRGVFAHMIDPCDTYEELYKKAVAIITKNDIASTGDRIVVLGGGSVGAIGITDSIKIITL